MTKINVGNLVLDINSKLGVNTVVADSGNQSASFSGTIDTGSYSLNALISGSIYGGLPNNKITAFAALESTGKTFLALTTVKSFLDKSPRKYRSVF